MTDPIDYGAAKIAGWIKRSNPEETDDAERMSSTLSLLLNNLLTTGLILFIGYLTDTLWSTAAMLAVFALCRIMLKGFHLKSMTLCVIITSAFVYLASIIPVSPLWMMILTPICILMIFFLSSASIPVRMLFGMLMAVNMILLYPPVFLGFAAQTLTLIPRRR
ncbi:MAG: putative accessory regulator protein [Paenibacillaceae bacterium]|nr:putative accessory regulator protein [Paenibacillaceae bacterium]